MCKKQGKLFFNSPVRSDIGCMGQDAAGQMTSAGLARITTQEHDLPDYLTLSGSFAATQANKSLAFEAQLRTVIGHLTAALQKHSETEMERLLEEARQRRGGRDASGDPGEGVDLSQVEQQYLCDYQCFAPAGSEELLRCTQRQQAGAVRLCAVNGDWAAAKLHGWRFDHAFYAAANTDLAGSSLKTAAQLLQHFLVYGAAEKRCHRCV
jgi:hypothetical protein